MFNFFKPKVFSSFWTFLELSKWNRIQKQDEGREYNDCYIQKNVEDDNMFLTKKEKGNQLKSIVIKRRKCL